MGIVTAVFLQKACDTKMALDGLSGCDVEDGLRKGRKKSACPLRGGLQKTGKD